MKHSNKRKLKPYYVWALVFFYFFASPYISEYFFNEKVVSIFLSINSIIFLLVGLFLLGSFIKTKNFMILLSAILFWFLSINTGLKVLFPIKFFIHKNVFIFPTFLLGIIIYIWMLMEFPDGDLFVRKIRALLEMAAKSVSDTKNGFTRRPYPAGKVKYSKEKIIEFSKYLNKHLIATRFRDKERVILIFSNGFFQYIPFLKPNFHRVTYVSLAYQGNISVNIKKSDYKKYKEELTFDQLCSSFGQIIQDCFNDFLDGKKITLLR